MMYSVVIYGIGMRDMDGYVVNKANKYFYISMCSCYVIVIALILFNVYETNENVNKNGQNEIIQINELNTANNIDEYTKNAQMQEKIFVVVMIIIMIIFSCVLIGILYYNIIHINAYHHFEYFYSPSSLSCSSSGTTMTIKDPEIVTKKNQKTLNELMADGKNFREANKILRENNSK